MSQFSPKYPSPPWHLRSCPNQKKLTTYRPPTKFVTPVISSRQIMLSLPSEVLERIYRLLLVTPEPVEFVRPDRITTSASSVRRQSQILRVNRQVHSHAVTIVYGENYFRCQTQRRYFYLMSAVGDANLSKIRTISLPLQSLQRVNVVAAWLPRLEYLEIHMPATKDLKHCSLRFAKEYLSSVRALLGVHPRLRILGSPGHDEWKVTGPQVLLAQTNPDVPPKCLKYFYVDIRRQIMRIDDQLSGPAPEH